MESRRSACDSCRRRRVRCGGSQPCAQCARSGIICTYGSIAHRQSATSYARSLEHQVADLQLQLQAINNAASRSSSAASATPLHADGASGQPVDDFVLRQQTGTKVFRYSAGLNLLRTVANMLGSGYDEQLPPVSNPGQQLLEIFERHVRFPPWTSLDWLSTILPTREHVLALTTTACDVALIFHDCVNRESLHARLRDLFDSGRMPEPNDRPFLALVYALLALGELWDAYLPRDGAPTTLGTADEGDRPRGLHFFEASRCVISEGVDLDSIQARLAQCRYLLAVSNFSAAHAALMPAISAAMQTGLHNDDTMLPDTFTAVEKDDRRRTFAALYMLETTVAFNLGLPRTLRHAFPQQCVGLRSEDIADEGRGLISRDPTSTEAITILAQKLVIIYAKMHDREFDRSSASFGSLDWISTVHSELQEWEAAFPKNLPSPASPTVVFGQMGLKLQYAGVQILLYAPCVHYLSKDRNDPSFSVRGYTYASNCVQAATEAVFAMRTMQRYNILTSAHWLNGYMLAWSTTILTYFVLHSRTRATIQETRDAALMANDMLKSLGERDEALRSIQGCLAPYLDLIFGTGEEDT